MRLIPSLILAAAASSGQAGAVTLDQLAGVWTMSGAYRQLPDGSRSNDYGLHPRGRLQIDRDGAYAVLIYESLPLEGAAKAPRLSTHFGRVRVSDDGKHLVFAITAASNPAWDGSEQVRQFSFDGTELVWQVPARPNGEIPISAWRRD